MANITVLYLKHVLGYTIRTLVSSYEKLFLLIILVANEDELNNFNFDSRFNFHLVNKPFILIFLLIISSCNLVESHYLHLSKRKKDLYRIDSIASNLNSANGLYSINSKEFESIINSDTVNDKLIVFFTWWCSSSEEFLPSFLDEFNKQDYNLKLFLISPDDWRYKYEYLDYYHKLDLKQNMYLLDVYSYGDKRSPHKKMAKFISEICSDCSDIKGFPSLILFDKENKIIYKKTEVVSFDTIKELMK